MPVPDNQILANEVYMHKTIDVVTTAEKGASLPEYASEGSSGADIRAHMEEDMVIPVGGTVLVPTGIRAAVPIGYELQVRPRSGLALRHGVTVLNTPGTIDSDYRGEIRIILINLGKEPFVISPRMRIAQIVLAPVYQASFIVAKDLEETARSAGGFGHTGVY